ncbi:MAG: ribbon-helix-helix domain-containing protein [Gloeomargarita sp. SKYB31]|nr:ribbon-helix-helix domain-containing protein [Gloeomargarita sp. SKYB31]
MEYTDYREPEMVKKRINPRSLENLVPTIAPDQPGTVVTLTAKVRPDQLQQLDEIAQQRGISRGFLVRQLLDTYLAGKPSDFITTSSPCTTDSKLTKIKELLERAMETTTSYNTRCYLQQALELINSNN